MKTNLVKEKLLRGEPTFGTWLSLGNLYAARLLARMGWDWLTLDLEHSPIDLEPAAAILAAVADAGCVPLVRVPEGSHAWIKRVLDAGAMGIVVPMVDTVEQAQAAIAAARYPPQGNRSVGGGWHALNFAAASSEYYAAANEHVLVVLQIESPRGVEQAEAIARLPGCDAIFIGPVDLRFQMRAADGAFPTPEDHEALVQRVIAAGRAAGTPMGIHTMDPHIARQRAAQGMQFLAVASDLRLMTRQAESFLETLHADRQRTDAADY
jgi:4-hydroxy-2-oxoheptanedioate aldolase